MEVVQGVKVPNSLLVSGITDTEADKELYDFLKYYGRIQRTISVDPPQYEVQYNFITTHNYPSSLSTTYL